MHLKNVDTNFSNNGLPMLLLLLLYHI